MNTIFIVVPILTILMFDLGLTLRLDDFARIVKRPRAILIALTGQIILLPLIAIALTHIFHLPPMLAIGLLLIACSPGGSSSNIFSKLAGGDVALSVTLTAVSSLITLITIPIIMEWGTTNLGNFIGITLPVDNLLKQNIVLMLLPVIIGIIVHYLWPTAAKAIDRVLAKVAFPALMLLITIFFIQNYHTIIDNIGTIGLCVLMLIVVAMCCASLLSKIGKQSRSEQRTIVIEVGMQNAAQAIAVATSPFVFNNAEIAIPAVVYSLLMNLVLLPYVAIIRFRDKRNTVE